jgi:hypothetical protein
MIKEVLEYRNIAQRIPSLIKNSPYKTDYFIKQLTLKQATFYRKLRDNDFTIDEVEKIICITNPEEKLLLDLIQGEADLANGNISDHNEVMQRLRKKYAV